MGRIGNKTKKDDHAKLKELILYISDRCQGHGKFGAIKLNKILFFSDFIAYAKYGKSITGETYFKLPMGPAPRQLKPVREGMLDERILIIQQRDTLKGVQERPIALRPPDLSLFQSWEIALVDSIIDALRDKDADEVSELSHYYMGWKIVAEKENIPYETVFLRDPKEIVLTQNRIGKAKSIARLHNLE